MIPAARRLEALSPIPDRRSREIETEGPVCLTFAQARWQR